MRQRSVLIVVGITAIVTGEWICGYVVGAHSVPALQVTVQAPPAPFVAFGPDVETLREAVVFTNGDLEQNTFTSSVASCTSPRPKPQDMKLRYMNGERIK